MKPSKKIFSLCLAVLMLLSVSGIAFAAEDAKRDCPVIHIPGFYSSLVYGDVNDPESLLEIPSAEVITDFVKEKFVPALLAFCVDRDTNKLATNVSSKVNELFVNWFNESTGDAKENSGVIFDSEPEKVSADSKLIFHYDWRGDLVDIADDLNDYINHVTAVSESEKVAISCHSFGSNLILAYLTKYGNDKVSAIIFDSPACNGVAVVGNLLTGKVTLDAEFISYFLKSAMGEAEYAKLAASVLDIFELADIPGLATAFLDEIIEELAPAVYKETVAPLFGYWPGIWAMVPDGQIDEAMSYIFDDVLKDEDLSVLKARVEKYNTLVRENRENTLKVFDAAGKFAILSRYGAPAFPLTDSSDLIGDTVIETESSSLGATTAPVGKYFSREDTAGVDEKYISPDRTINASTCLFPEKTWFIKNTGHFETELTVPYYDFFLFSKDELTCDKTDFGRFCTFDRETLSLTADTSEPQKTENPSPLARLFRFLAALFEQIKGLLVKVFG